MSTTARRRPGTAFRTKPSEEFATMLKGSEVWAEACEMAKKEKRPVAFSLSHPTGETRIFMAWPDGTVTSPGVRRKGA